jgi:hypothetical protein
MTRYVAAAPTYSVATLAASLRKRESGHITTTILMLIGGIVWLIVAIAVIATIPWGMQFGRRGRALMPPGSWSWYFIMTAAIAGPILFLLEYATRGSLLNDAANEHADYGPYAQRMVGRGMAVIIFIEMGLWGPRSILSGVRRISGRKAMTGADRNAAATIVANLLRGGDGLPTGAALKGVADALSADALTYLAYYDWVGISTSGDRVWLLSESKRALNV